MSATAALESTSRPLNLPTVTSFVSYPNRTALSRPTWASLGTGTAAPRPNSTTVGNITGQGSGYGIALASGTSIVYANVALQPASKLLGGDDSSSLNLTDGDTPCDGPNGESGVLRRRALSAYPGALPTAATSVVLEPEIFCSVEQHITENQLLPPSTWGPPVMSITPLALPDVIGNLPKAPGPSSSTSAAIMFQPKQTAVSSSTRNSQLASSTPVNDPNAHMPEQLPQLHQALQPSSVNAPAAQSNLAPAMSPSANANNPAIVPENPVSNIQPALNRQLGSPVVQPASNGALPVISNQPASNEQPPVQGSPSLVKFPANANVPIAVNQGPVTANNPHASNAPIAPNEQLGNVPVTNPAVVPGSSPPGAAEPASSGMTAGSYEAGSPSVPEFSGGESGAVGSSQGDTEPNAPDANTIPTNTGVLAFPSTFPADGDLPGLSPPTDTSSGAVQASASGSGTPSKSGIVPDIVGTVVSNQIPAAALASAPASAITSGTISVNNPNPNSSLSSVSSPPTPIVISSPNAQDQLVFSTIYPSLPNNPPSDTQNAASKLLVLNSTNSAGSIIPFSTILSQNGSASPAASGSITVGNNGSSGGFGGIGGGILTAAGSAVTSASIAPGGGGSDRNRNGTNHMSNAGNGAKDMVNWWEGCIYRFIGTISVFIGILLW